MSVILALGKLRLENHEFEASLGSIARHCLETKTENNMKHTKPETESMK
jgi:hypothetical protein